MTDAAKRNKILDLIASDKAQRNYFFREVKDPEWLPWLEQAGYLDEKLAPIPEHVENGISYPDWEVLPFMARIAEKSTNDPIAAKQIPLIVTFFNKATKAHAGNWRTLYWLAKILSSLPRSQITLEMIRSIRGWLDIAGHSDMISPELCCELLPRLLSENPSDSDVQKAEVLSDVILTTKKNEKNNGSEYWSDKYKFCLDDYWLRTGIEKSEKLLGAHLTKAGILNLKKKIIELLQSGMARHSREVEIGDKKLELAYVEGADHFLLRLFEGEKTLHEEKIGIVISRKNLLQAANTTLKLLEKSNPEPSDPVEESLLRIHALLLSEECAAAIYDSSAWRDRDPLTLLIRLLCAVLDFKLNRNEKLPVEIVKEFFAEPYLMFPKIGLYLVGRYPQILRQDFFVALEGVNGDVLFEELFFGQELKSALEAISESFSDDEIRSLDKQIDAGSILWIEGERDQSYKDFWRQQRYGALSKSEHFRNKYEALKALREGKDAALRPAFGPIESRWGWGDSPLSSDKLIGEDCKAIAALLRDFKQTSSWEGPTFGGLADALEAAVKQDPNHFLNDLSAFLDSAYIWIARIIRGLGDASKDQNFKVWDTLIPFISSYASRDSFWKNELGVVSIANVFNPNYEWVVGDFCSLVERACRENAVAVSDSQLDSIKTLLRGWITRLTWPAKHLHEEPVMQAINATEGKQVETILQLCLCVARRAYGNAELPLMKWQAADQQLIDELIQAGHAEVMTFAGMYLPNLFYLDRPWIIALLPSVIDKPNWHCFMTGYLHQARYYDELYERLALHYKKARQESSTLDKHSTESLIEHSTLAYVRNKDDLTGDTLFASILMDGNFDDFQKIFGFVGQLAINARKDKDDSSVFELSKNFTFSKIESFAPRIIKLWENALEIIEAQGDKLGEKAFILYGELLEFTGFLKEIDESSKLLLLRTLSHGLPRNREFPFFLEYLIEAGERSKTEVSAFNIGQIFLRLMDHCNPSFQRETIIELVNFLYQFKSSAQLANKICEKYGRNGYDFLKPIYDKNKANLAP